MDMHHSRLRLPGPMVNNALVQSQEAMVRGKAEDYEPSTSASHTAEAIIYSTANQYSAELVTGDSHMKGFEGTQFIE